MNRASKEKLLSVFYLLSGVFLVVWSVKKYTLGVNKNFFFGQFAVIGLTGLIFTIIARFLKTWYSEKINNAIADGKYTEAMILTDRYILSEVVSSDVYLGRAFFAMLHNDSETIRKMLSKDSKTINDADKYIIGLLSAVITAREGDTVSANIMMEEMNYDFSGMENKDFYFPLIADLEDYCDGITALNNNDSKALRSLIKRREKHTLAGVYKQIMDLLWEKLQSGEIYVLKSNPESIVKGFSFNRYTRTALAYVLFAAVLLAPSDMNLKNEYDSLRELTDSIDMFNEVSCAYGNDELYYVKYYDFNGKYNDLIFEVNNGKYVLCPDSEIMKQEVSGIVDARGIDIHLYKTQSSENGVLVIEEHTIDVPAKKVTYDDRLAFTSLLKGDVQGYAVHMGLYDGDINDLTVLFDWGDVVVSELEK
ncbi:MAG: hypothetical protein E7218_08205 [Anaerofustis stercorihominis]|nr:hypothetical protein [Anaerofustis stercorihominis]